MALWHKARLNKQGEFTLKQERKGVTGKGPAGAADGCSHHLRLSIGPVRGKKRSLKRQRIQRR